MGPQRTGISESSGQEAILCCYAENPPDRVIAEDDILFLDLGPVFEEWEADFGRTFVIGCDPVKEKLLLDAERAFAEGKGHFQSNPAITASETVRICRSSGEELGVGVWRSNGRSSDWSISARANSR